MTDDFDPYRRWLGIPPEEQPPHHYRFLGIGLFESDPDVIESAADRQMAHVQRHKLGPNAAVSQRVLNELSTAMRCLLDPQKKTAYDAALRAELAKRQAVVAQAARPAAPMAVPVAMPVQAAATYDYLTPPVAPPRRLVRRKKTSAAWILMPVGLVVALVLAALFIYILRYGELPAWMQPGSGISQSNEPKAPVPKKPNQALPEPAPQAKPPEPDPKAIAVVQSAPRLGTAQGLLVDDGAGFRELAPGWTREEVVNAYRGDYLTHHAPEDKPLASWTVVGIEAGKKCEVLATWPAGERHCSKAVYEVLDGDKVLESIEVDQRRAPQGRSRQKVAWQSLGHFTFESGSLTVRISSLGDGLLVADAIQVVPSRSARRAQAAKATPLPQQNAEKKAEEGAVAPEVDF